MANTVGGGLQYIVGKLVGALLSFFTGPFIAGTVMGFFVGFVAGIFEDLSIFLQIGEIFEGLTKIGELIPTLISNPGMIFEMIKNSLYGIINKAFNFNPFGQGGYTVQEWLDNIIKLVEDFFDNWNIDNQTLKDFISADANKFNVAFMAAHLVGYIIQQMMVGGFLILGKIADAAGIAGDLGKIANSLKKAAKSVGGMVKKAAKSAKMIAKKILKKVADKVSDFIHKLPFNVGDDVGDSLAGLASTSKHIDIYDLDEFYYLGVKTKLADKGDNVYMATVGKSDDFCDDIINKIDDPDFLTKSDNYKKGTFAEESTRDILSKNGHSIKGTHGTTDPGLDIISKGPDGKWHFHEVKYHGYADSNYCGRVKVQYQRSKIEIFDKTDELNKPWLKNSINNYEGLSAAERADLLKAIDQNNYVSHCHIIKPSGAKTVSNTFSEINHFDDINIIQVDANSINNALGL
jgi:hypothetical protein